MVFVCLLTVSLAQISLVGRYSRDVARVTGPDPPTTRWLIKDPVYKRKVKLHAGSSMARSVWEISIDLRRATHACVVVASCWLSLTE